MTYELRQDDIMPLADNAHNYWSGYFTSRPALKRQVRFADFLFRIGAFTGGRHKYIKKGCESTDLQEGARRRRLLDRRARGHRRRRDAPRRHVGHGAARCYG